MPDIKRMFRALTVALCLFFASGCGMIDYFYLPTPEETAQEIFEAGNDAMRDKNYVKAIAYYTKLKDNFPFSPYTQEAELSLADAQYLDADYQLAADSYKDFEALHPRSEAIPYVLYQTGMSLFNSYNSVDRPATNVQEAMEYFQRLKESYPNNEFAEKAGEYIQKCRVILAERELFLGNMFWRMGKYGSAWHRYSYIVDNFADVPEVHKVASEKAVAAYYRYREQESDEVRVEREGTWKNWFKWL